MTIIHFFYRIINNQQKKIGGASASRLSPPLWQRPPDYWCQATPLLGGGPITGLLSENILAGRIWVFIATWYSSLDGTAPSCVNMEIIASLASCQVVLKRVKWLQPSISAFHLSSGGAEMFFESNMVVIVSTLFLSLISICIVNSPLPQRAFMFFQLKKPSIS